MKSKWEEYYRRYRKLERDWYLPNTPMEIVNQTFRRVLTDPKDPAISANEIKHWGYPLPNEALWVEALELRDPILKIDKSCSAEEPMEDAYQTALFMAVHTDWQMNETRTGFYRGQRKHTWDLRPALYRDRPSKQEVSERIIKIRGLVQQLQQKNPSLTDEESAAIVQHYSREARAKTWLIDVTWDPFVALFFASDSGEAGDIGVVSYVSLGEWDKFSARGKNRLGPIKIIEPKQIPRIEAQKAAFIDTSHPDLWEQLVPHSLYFWQKPGLIFEDDTFAAPIIKATIYPEVDKYKEQFGNIESLNEGVRLSCEPTPNALDPLNESDYLNIVTSWYVQKEYKADEAKLKAMECVCKFHAKLQQYRSTIDVPERSLHRLDNAVDCIFKLDAHSLREAVESSLKRDPREEIQQLMNQIVTQIEKEFDC